MWFSVFYLQYSWSLIQSYTKSYSWKQTEETLTVFFGESQVDLSEEFVHWNVDFRGEVIGKQQGKDHKHVVRDDLKHVRYENILIQYINLKSFQNHLTTINTLKLVGSTRSEKAWSSLSLNRPVWRSSICSTALRTPWNTVRPCFLTWGEPRLKSIQWEK